MLLPIKTLQNYQNFQSYSDNLPVKHHKFLANIIANVFYKKKYFVSMQFVV